MRVTINPGRPFSVSFDDADSIIVLELTEDDKRNIANMAPEARFFAIGEVDEETLRQALSAVTGRKG